VMFRASTATNSPMVVVVATPSQGLNLQWRKDPGGKPDHTPVRGVTAPVWVKLARSGNKFSGFYSADGTQWKPVGKPQAIAVGPTVLVGLCVTAHTNALLNTSTFDHVAVQ